ncbi:hypothetical protein [Cupriavidus basilensis]
MDGYVSKSAFAKIYGCGLSYVTKLKSEGKLVISEDGRLVNVEASLRLIESTRDLSKLGVRERWTAYRAGQDLPTAVVSAATAPISAAAGTERDENSSAYHRARTEREQIDAQLKKLELRKLLGEVSEVGPMIRAVHDSHAAARAALLQLPDRLAGQVAPETDPAKVHDLLRAECERVCSTMVREVERMVELAMAGAVV